MTERKRITVRIPKQLYDELKEDATKKGYTLNALIVSILWDQKNNLNTSIKAQ